MDDRTGRKALFWAGLAVVAAAVRTVVVLLRAPPLDGDQRLYLSLAESLHDRTGYVFDSAPQLTVHPLLPLLHSLLLALFDDARTTGIALTIAIGSLVPLAGGLLVSRMLGFVPGLLAGSFLALQPHHVLRSSYLEPDLLAALLCFWVALLVVREKHGLAGCVLGLAYWNRPEMLFLIPVVAAIARLRGAVWSRVLRLVAGSLLLSGVFVLYLYGATGRVTVTGKDHWTYVHGVHQYRSGNRPIPFADVEKLQEEIGSPAAHLVERPAEFALGYGYRLGLLLHRIALQLGYVLIPLAVLGALAVARRTRSGLALILLPVFLLPLLPLVVTFFRHSLIAGAALVALAGAGAATVWERRRSKAAP